jgi:predicted alpha/beta superfamily hydrolase
MQQKLEKYSLLVFFLGLMTPLVMTGHTRDTIIHEIESTPISLGEQITIGSGIYVGNRNILVSLPSSYNQNDQRYPVVYFTDASVTRLLQLRGLVAALSENGKMPEVILVGITHERRDRELTPPGEYMQLYDGKLYRPGNETGGADSLLRFLEEEIIPFVERKYRTNPSRIYIGHSHGGLFGFYTLLMRPGLFNGSILVDPSLWWNQAGLIDTLESRIKPNNLQELSLFISFTGFTTQTPRERLRKIFRKQPVPGINFSMVDYTGKETHGSAFLPTVREGLGFLFKPWQLPTDADGEIDFESLSLSLLDTHYGRKILGFVYPVPEQFINALGYNRLFNGKNEEAITIFRENTIRYPGSANTWDSLGESFGRSGRIPDARQAYSKAVETATQAGDPNVTVYKNNLLRVKFR